MKIYDYWADGHYVAATDERAAREVCITLYDHAPEVVHPWTTEDDEEN